MNDRDLAMYCLVQRAVFRLLTAVLLLVLFAIAANRISHTAASAPSRAAASSGVFLNRTNETTSGTVVVDASGVVHYAYSDWNSVNAAFYSSCAAGCASLANWSIAMIDDGTNTVKLAYLGFDGAGHPRMILFALGSGFDHGWQYTECNADCGNGANWATPVWLVHSVALTFASGVQEAAFDPQGNPRFVYVDTDQNNGHFGTFYKYCDSACTNPASWSETQIAGDRLKQPALTFTASGQPRVLIGDWTSIISPTEYLNYGFCDSGCDDPNNWGGIRLYEQGSYSSWSLRLDSQGRPRVAFYQDATSGGDVKLLNYLWCNTSCDAGTNWDGVSIGLAQSDGQEPDLALDSAGRPRIAYDRGGGTGTGGGGLGYVICNTACESAGGVWQDQLFEANSTLDTDWPAAGSAGGFWYGGYRPSLALDAGGNPFIGYYATHICNSCGNGGLPMENWRAARFVFASNPTPCCVRVFLPLIKR